MELINSYGFKYVGILAICDEDFFWEDDAFCGDQECSLDVMLVTLRSGSKSFVFYPTA